MIDAINCTAFMHAVSSKLIKHNQNNKMQTANEIINCYYKFNYIYCPGINIKGCPIVRASKMSFQSSELYYNTGSQRQVKG